MFDYMIRKLDNGKILLRNLHTKDNDVMEAKELIEYLEKQFEEQIEAQEEEDMRTRSIRSEAAGAPQKPSK